MECRHLDARQVEFGKLVVNDDHLFRIADRKLTKQYGIDDAEYRCSCADSERQRDDSHEREAGVPEQHPQAITQILQEIFNKIDSSHIPTHLLVLLYPAQRSQGCIARLRFTHALPAVLFYLPL